MKKILFSTMGLFFACNTSQKTVTEEPKSAKEINVSTIAASITEDELKEHLYVYASDEYEGRETGTPGNDMAAGYIAQHFKALKLNSPIGEDDFLQPIDMSSERWEKIDMTVNGEEYRHIWDFFALHQMNAGIDEFNYDEITFVGYGIDDEKLNNYKKTDISGKVVMMYGGEPKDEDGKSVITDSDAMSDWTNNPFKKIMLAKEKGAKSVLIISEQFKKQISDNRRFLMGPSVTLTPPSETTDNSTSDFSYIIINPEIAKSIAGKKLKKVKKYRSKNSRGKSTKGFNITTDISGHMVKQRNSKKTANVIGVIEGKHPTKKKEHIIVTAHYDHLGKRGSDIFNGADDNASGTSTVLELAEAYATAAAFGQAPDRSIIFLLVSGEEKGLLGSKFYTDYPLIPLDQTMVNINIDMVGRMDEQHDNGNYIYVIGADRLSTTLHEVNESVNDLHEKLLLDYTYNAEDDPNRYYYRSDHYNFAEKGIPAVFFFNGTHDDYHRPSDTADKIDYDKMAKIGRHIFHLIWELGNREDAIEVDVKP